MSSTTRKIVVEPVASWPRHAEIGRSYLVTVDLRLRPSNQQWPYDYEELEFGFTIDGAPLFACVALGVPSIVLHRFGRTYGPAQFLATAGLYPATGAIWLTITNRWGVPLRTIELPCQVTAASTNATAIGVPVQDEPKADSKRLPKGPRAMSDEPLTTEEQVARFYGEWPPQPDTPPPDRPS